jgi:FtsH-binding integral membrane protein
VPQPAPGCDAHGRRLRRPALSLRHLTEDDAIWLATGIFVSIVNIFLSLLNLSRS